jgi:hypothetical protein
MIKVGDIYESDKSTQNGRKVIAIGEAFVNSYGQERIPVTLEDAVTGNHGEIYLTPKTVYGA